MVHPQTQCGATLNPLLRRRTKLPVTLKPLDEMKNVSQQTPPKITETIWVKPLFQFEFEGKCLWQALAFKLQKFQVLTLPRLQMGLKTQE